LRGHNRFGQTLPWQPFFATAAHGSGRTGFAPGRRLRHGHCPELEKCVRL